MHYCTYDFGAFLDTTLVHFFLDTTLVHFLDTTLLFLQDDIYRI